MRFVLVVAILAIAGCAPLSRTFVLSPELNKAGAPLWGDEAKKRFENPIVVVTHGMIAWDAETLTPHWVITADPDALGEFMQRQFPGQPIVFVSCNSDGYAMNRKGVWYFKHDVSSRPHDRPKNYPASRPIDNCIQQAFEGGK